MAPWVFSQIASVLCFSCSGEREKSSTRFYSRKTVERQQTQAVFRGEPYPLSPLQRSGSISSSTGTWPVALETPLCASGTSARRHRISHARVSMRPAI